MRKNMMQRCYKSASCKLFRNRRIRLNPDCFVNDCNRQTFVCRRSQVSFPISSDYVLFWFISDILVLPERDSLLYTYHSHAMLTLTQIFVSIHCRCDPNVCRRV
ncbi:unnamed protein product [Albugo candida]|uniref:Uncharacterized protein n=1 Tax=Albugo candida TaxID=65357 RepID=A0A024FTS8_9STRA|nr:unnamed protein product [Albugo candida]|eukprot:CCI10505.1 unnamed protein product [Albugo candida]